MENTNNNILFIGNFVNDVILIHEKLKLEKERSFSDFMSTKTQKELSDNYNSEDHSGLQDGVTKAEALGGSVTYGSLAAHYFGNTKSYIVTKFGNDINKEFETLIKSKSSIDLSFSSNGGNSDIKNTSYYLNYYNNKKNRTLSLMEKGFDVDIASCIKCIKSVHPEAILFVPVAGEFDEHLVMETLEFIKKLNDDDDDDDDHSKFYRPVIAFDIQGFLRSFNGARVTTRPKYIMIQKLVNIKMSITNNNMDSNIITVVKAEYGEAAAIMGDHDPATCAKLLRINFGFTIVAVTMGGDGLFISSSVTDELYIPTFKPDVVSDETGCGDTFLTCTILELLNLLKSKEQQHKQQPNGQNRNKVDDNQINVDSDDILIKKGIKKDELIQCLQVGSSGASFLVEKIGPNGFASRDKIIDRVINGTKQVKQQYLKFDINGGDKASSIPILKTKEEVLLSEQAENNVTLPISTNGTDISNLLVKQKKQFKSTTSYK